jgi:tetratricopeptide (TPR) repeat protein
VARILSKLAATYMAQGDMDTGRALYERALVITQRAYGPEHPEVAGLLNNLGVLHVHTGDLEKARELLLQSLPLMEKALGPDHVQLTPSLCSLGGVSLETGHMKEAVAYLERCVQIFDAHEGEQPSEYWARFDLARALVASGGDTTRAVELARQAASHIHAEPTPDPDEKARVEAFLSKYGRSRRRGG